MVYVVLRGRVGNAASCATRVAKSSGRENAINISLSTKKGPKWHYLAFYGIFTNNEIMKKYQFFRKKCPLGNHACDGDGFARKTLSRLRPIWRLQGWLPPPPLSSTANFKWRGSASYFLLHENCNSSIVRVVSLCLFVIIE